MKRQYAIRSFLLGLAAIAMVGCTDGSVSSQLEVNKEEAEQTKEQKTYEYQVSWAGSLKRPDGTTVKPDEIQYYEVEVARQDGSEKRLLTVDSSGFPKVKHQVPNFPTGQWVMKVRVVDGNGVQSKWSKDIPFSVGDDQSE